MLLLAVAATISAIDVRVEGPGYTRADAILRLMEAQPGALFDADALQHDLSRLRTLGILYDVDATTSDGGKHIEVRARDRWSLVPVLGLRRGGGRTTARLGVSDHNAFGDLFSLYGELTSNAQIPFVSRTSADRVGSYVYAQVPRIFGTRLTPKLSWLRDYSDFTAYSAAGARAYVYDRAREEGRFELRFEVIPLVTLLAGADLRADGFATSDISPAAGTAPADTKQLAAIAGFELGQIEQDVSQSRGVELDFATEASGAALSATLQARAFAAHGRHNLCLDLVAQATTGRGDALLFRAGGQKEIRGFLDAYFEGQRLLRANAEWRFDLATTRWLVPLVTQLAAFVDAGYVAKRADAVAGLPYEGPIAAAGVGLRAIPIPFARAVGRLDVARGLWPQRTLDVSFSGQQFF